jgi:hypothetical protein
LKENDFYNIESHDECRLILPDLDCLPYHMGEKGIDDVSTFGIAGVSGSSTDGTSGSSGSSGTSGNSGILGRDTQADSEAAMPIPNNNSLMYMIISSIKKPHISEANRLFN